MMTQKNSYFKINRKENSVVYYTLHAANDNLLMTSEDYTTDEACESDIALAKKAVALHADSITTYAETQKDVVKYTFKLRGGNGKVLGVGPSFISEEARDNCIASIKLNAPGAAIQYAKRNVEPIMYKVFSVLVRDKEYDVYNINGKEHMGLNGAIKTWWLYYDNKLPDGLLPPLDSDKLVPYPEKCIKRICWEIKVKEHNTHKIKWDDHDFSHTAVCEMWANNKLIYSFMTLHASWAMSKAQYLQIVLSEHVFNFFEPLKENGRKIYWYGLPATLVVTEHTPWEVSIRPDYSSMPKVFWWKEYKRRKDPCDKEFADMENESDAEHMGSDLINWGDVLSDGHIGWFRKDSDINKD